MFPSTEAIFSLFLQKKTAYLGSVAIVSAPVIVDEIILKDVCSGLGFSEAALPTQDDLLIWLL